MFPYWNAPPSLLRIWACPDEPVPLVDSRFRFHAPAVQAGLEIGAILGRIRDDLRVLLRSRTTGRQLPAC